MSDETKTVALEMKASTAAAVTEVSKLGAAIREHTTAATVAGSAQQQLGKEIALTKAKQVEATEAAKAQKQALDTLVLTEQAFGKESRQAADAAAKLAAAEREAAKASTIAADALAAVAKEVKSVAAAEDGDLSPATKRAAAQVAAMGASAQRTSQDLHRMELQSQAAARATEQAAHAADQKLVKAHERAGAEMARLHGSSSKLTSQIDQAAYATKRGAGGFGGLAKEMAPVAAGMGAVAVAAVALGTWLGDAAEKTLQFETAVANIPFKLDGATKATRGLISEQQLVASAAGAAALKVTLTAERFEQLSGASVKLAQKLGQPADQLMNNLVTALGRGSTELLDNAGVVLKTAEAQERYAKAIGTSAAMLTDAQKAEAFKVEAFKAIIAAANETTVSFDSNAAAVVRWKVKAGDAWDSLERSAANAAGAIIKTSGGLNLIFHDEDWIPTITATAAALDNTWSPAFTRGAEATAKFAADLLLAGDAYEVAAQFLNPGNLAAMEAANGKEREKRDILSEEAAFAERAAKAMQAAEKANADFLDAQAVHAITYGPEEAPKRKKSGAKKKKQEMLDPGDVAIARTFDGVEQTELAARAAPEAAAEQRATAEQRRFEEETLRNERATEMLTDRVGLEEETEARRAALQDQQIKRERDYAYWQVNAARSQAQREQALTKVEEVEHRKRVLAAQRAAAEEGKIAAQRQGQFERIASGVTDLGKAAVAAAWEQAAGQKGAIAMMLGDRLKGISIDATITAAWETAQGVAALAGIYTAGLAPGHFAAAAEAAAVAAAAGIAGAGIGAVGKSASGGGAAGGRPANGSSYADAAARGGQTARAPVEGQEQRQVERLEVPISYAPNAPAQGGGVTIQIGNYIGGKDSEKSLAETVRRSNERSKAQGRRY